MGRAGEESVAKRGCQLLSGLNVGALPAMQGATYSRLLLPVAPTYQSGKQHHREKEKWQEIPSVELDVAGMRDGSRHAFSRELLCNIGHLP